jgi:hypothetical protein
MIEGLTQTQFAALAKLFEVGPCSQNHLGRLIYLDATTIKAVVDRLSARGFVIALAAQGPSPPRGDAERARPRSHRGSNQGGGRNHRCYARATHRRRTASGGEVAGKAGLAAH